MPGESSRLKSLSSRSGSACSSWFGGSPARGWAWDMRSTPGRFLSGAGGQRFCCSRTTPTAGFFSAPIPAAAVCGPPERQRGHHLYLPWNPARLEQRIARAWRKNQTRSVTVINLVSEGTIEHRMLGTLANKASAGGRSSRPAGGSEQVGAHQRAANVSVTAPTTAGTVGGQPAV